MSEALVLTVGNIYVDHNLFGVRGGDNFTLESGKDYFGNSGERVLGGSAVNAAMQIKRLGLDVAFIGKTGSDEGSIEVRSLLEKEGIDASLVSQNDSFSTSMAVNLIDSKGEFIGIHYGDASKQLGTDDIDTNHSLFSRAKGIYFGGTAKQSRLFQNLESLFKEIDDRGIDIFYDPNRFPAEESKIDAKLLLNQLRYVTGYFPNQDELLQATGESSIDRALEHVIETGVKFIALKLGADGCRIKTLDQDLAVSGLTVVPKTTVGAGDCFNATFISYYLDGNDLQDCAKYATKAASIKVGQNVWPYRDQIENS